VKLVSVLQEMEKILVATLLFVLVSQGEFFSHERNITFVYKMLLMICVMHDVFRL